MLILERLVDERIVIEGGIIITVVEAHDGKAKIGIEAPRSIGVDREEVWLVKQQNGMKQEVPDEA